MCRGSRLVSVLGGVRRVSRQMNEGLGGSGSEYVGLHGCNGMPFARGAVNGLILL